MEAKMAEEGKWAKDIENGLEFLKIFYLTLMIIPNMKKSFQ
jgi:hypothetical protein